MLLRSGPTRSIHSLSDLVSQWWNSESSSYMQHSCSMIAPSPCSSSSTNRASSSGASSSTLASFQVRTAGWSDGVIGRTVTSPDGKISGVVQSLTINSGGQVVAKLDSGKELLLGGQDRKEIRDAAAVLRIVFPPDGGAINCR